MEVAQELVFQKGEDVALPETMAKCDKCGKRATRGCRDIKEVYSYNPWREFEYDGEWRYGCDRHPPKPNRVKYL